MEWQEWQTGLDIRNHQSTTSKLSKDESNDKPVIGHYQQPFHFSIEV